MNFAQATPSGHISVGLPAALRGHSVETLAGLGWKPLRWVSHAFDPDTQYYPDAPSYSDQGDHILGDHVPVAMPSEVRAARDLSLAHAAKPARLEAVNAEYQRRLDAGFVYGGQRYQIDGEAQGAMATVLAAFAANASNPHGGVWRTKANTMIAMSDSQCRTFLTAALTRVQHLKAVCWAKKDAISAAVTPAAVAGVSLGDGWDAA